MVTSAEYPKRICFVSLVPPSDTTSTTAGPAGASGAPHYHGHLSPLTSTIKNAKIHKSEHQELSYTHSVSLRTENALKQGSEALPQPLN